MSETTLKELRQRAKALGLKGYSRLAKQELLRRVGLLSTSSPSTSATERAERERRTVRARRADSRKAATERFDARPPLATEIAPRETVMTKVRETPAATTPPSAEELVEDAKYALRPQGGPTPAAGADLGEDIDRLPALHEPAVCLLAQKPGVLYAYWRLSPEDASARGDYRLRLCRVDGDTAQVHEEVAIPQDRGGWYFHVPPSMNGQEASVQLGYYRDGRFVPAQGQSVARLPSMYASLHTDHRWWISASDFERLYARAGGVVSAQRFRWSASIGSPTTSADQRMSWPGGVSSPAK